MLAESRDPQVWAVHINSQGGIFKEENRKNIDEDAEREKQFKICLDGKFIGLGWSLGDNDPNFIDDFGIYEALFQKNILGVS